VQNSTLNKYGESLHTPQKDGGSLNLLKKIEEFIKSFFIISMSDSEKHEFEISINKINIARAKVTSLTFAILEALMLTIHVIANKARLFTIPYVYYGFMYILMLLVMLVFLIIFSILGADLSNNLIKLRTIGIFFIGFILSWCAAISLLDQLSSGQVIVYIEAVLSIAITPFYKPLRLFLVYITIHTIFLIALPYFQEYPQLILGNSINTSTFVIMSWAISYMRYKKQAEDFINKKIILKKNEELQLINMQLQKVNQNLEKLSMTDSLTGAFNRYSFERLIIDEWNRCQQQSIPLSLMMVDIDFFKQFNDTYGHQEGDRCIKLVADILAAYTNGSSYMVARYGGDEFFVLLPDTNKENALNLAEQMRKTVEEKYVPHLNSNISDYVTISVGINTIIPSAESSIDELISNTDKALYLAKKRRNCSVAV